MGKAIEVPVALALAACALAATCGPTPPDLGVGHRLVNACAIDRPDSASLAFYLAAICFSQSVDRRDLEAVSWFAADSILVFERPVLGVHKEGTIILARAEVGNFNLLRHELAHYLIHRFDLPIPHHSLAFYRCAGQGW